MKKATEFGVQAPEFLWQGFFKSKNQLQKGLILILQVLSASSFLILAGACSRASKQSAEVNVNPTPTEFPNPIAADSQSAVTIRLPELLRLRKEGTIVAEVSGSAKWEWRQLSGPGTMIFSQAHETRTQVRADQDGSYFIRFTGTDLQNRQVSAEMQVNWDATGPKVSVSEEIKAFTTTLLEAQVGSDAVSIQWEQLDGPAPLVILDRKAKSTQVTASADGIYKLRLTAQDDLGNESAAEVKLVWDSVAPQVNVGPDKISNIETKLEATTVDATSYKWTQVSGPGKLFFSDALAEDTLVKADQDGTYLVRLSITRSNGVTAFDELRLIWDTTAPRIDLGMDLQVRYRAFVDATLDEGLDFNWSQISGPGSAKFSTPRAKATSIASTSAGTYEFELKVTDLAGNISKDQIRIIFENDPQLLAKQLSAGGASSCVVLDDQGVSCWGYNYAGELGFGDSMDRYLPPTFGVQLGSQRTAVAVAAGYSHHCAVLSEGSVKCWGSNSYGELGYGDQKALARPIEKAVDLGIGRTARAIAVGLAHSCAILDDYSVKCWGSNAAGQLGYGDYKNRLSPPLVTLNLGLGRTARSLALGAYHTCARLDDGNLKCWGSNTEGQLGDGDKSFRNAPATEAIPIPKGLRVLNFAVGHYHGCAVLSDNSVSCWGRNGQGQLGLGHRIERNSLQGETVNLSSPLRVIEVTAGQMHSCALLEDGTIQCWGDNEEGQLASGDLLPKLAPSLVPLQIGEGRTAIQIAAGRLHTCALLDNRNVKCWGSNSYGQLGSGDTRNKNEVPKLPISYDQRLNTALTQK